MKRLFVLCTLLLFFRVTELWAACPQQRPPGCGAQDTSIVITDCGASCNGDQPSPHDDTVAINCALDTVGHNGGGEVIIPPLTCIIKPSPTSTDNPDNYLHLYSNLTIRGAGPKSVLRVAPNTGNYFAVFSPPSDATALTNVTIRDFTIDQGANATDDIRTECAPGCGEYAIWGWNPVTNVPISNKITVSGMYFDRTTSTNTITLGANGELDAIIINNYFNFVKHTTVEQYDNSAVYLEGSQQVVTGNTFVSTLPQFANATLETHGGRSTVSNNTSINYAVLVNVVPTRPDLLELVPNNIVISGNSVTCGQVAIQLWPAGLTLRNVAITGNTIQICNQQRVGFKAGASSVATGIFFVPVVGSFENILIENNIITHEQDDQANLDSWGTSINAIQVQNYVNPAVTHSSNLTNIFIRKNVIKDAPIGGIRIAVFPDCFAQSDQQNKALNVGVTDNTIIDAGRNQHNPSSLNAAISVVADLTPLCVADNIIAQVKNVDISRNMIVDTGSTTPNGKYSLYVYPRAGSTNIQTSQNTVRFTPGQQGQVLKSFVQQSTEFGDATASNSVRFVSASTSPLSFDFTSATQYIVTIGTPDGVLTVLAPNSDPGGSWANWVVGQVVNFRFVCAVATGGTCTVHFDSKYSTLGDLTIASGGRQAITLQVESWAPSGAGHFFYELYRGPVVSN